MKTDREVTKKVTENIKTDTKTVTKRTHLTREEYLEWRLLIEKLHHAQSKHRITELDCKLMQKDAELLSARALIFAKTKIEEAKADKESSKTDYEKCKAALEATIGFSLNGKAISDETLEIIDLPSS